MVSLFLGRGEHRVQGTATRAVARLWRTRRQPPAADAGVEFVVDGRPCRFRLLRELDQFLGQRRRPRSETTHAVPSDSEQGQGLRRQLALLEQVARDVEADRTAVLEQLRSLDLRVFTKEHGWRDLWRQLLATKNPPAWSVNCMLHHYSGYLRSRLAGRLTTPDGSPEDEALKQTAVLSPSMIAGLAGVAEDSLALPAGVATGFELPIGGKLDMHLATRAFRLCREEDGYRLLDCGCDTPGLLRNPIYRLREGRNLIGRSADCDLPVIPQYRDVSRVHLLIEVNGHAVWLTDLSAHGTHLCQSAWSHRVDHAGDSASCG